MRYVRTCCCCCCLQLEHPEMKIRSSSRGEMAPLSWSSSPGHAYSASHPLHASQVNIILIEPMRICRFPSWWPVGVSPWLGASCLVRRATRSVGVDTVNRKNYSMQKFVSSPGVFMMHASFTWRCSADPLPFSAVYVCVCVCVCSEWLIDWCLWHVNAR